MIKTAIFVEGQTELIFVREYLLKYFEYQDIEVGCYSLFDDHAFIPVEYPFTPPTASHYFEIVNVGMDGNVLTRLLRREKFLWNTGFHKAIGLRDMYSKAYRDMTKVIDPALTQEFILETQKQIDRLATDPSKIAFHFAIMETEAWLLGLSQHFALVDGRFTPDFLTAQLGYDIDTIDPEIHFFHPANEIQKVFALAGMNYDKSKGDVNAIMSRLDRSHFVSLYQAEKCKSFTEFSDSLLGGLTKPPHP